MKIRQILLAFWAIGLCTAVQAEPILVADNYYGANDHGYGDVIGNTTVFDISKATIDLSGQLLTVDIYTNFVQYVGTASAYGAQFGDLFLNKSWDPYGALPYDSDYANATTTTHWGWGLSMDSGTGSSGIVTLYELASNNVDASLSDAVYGSGHPGYTYRNGQEVRVETSSMANRNTNVTGTWRAVDDSGTGNDYLQFSINLADTSLLSAIDPASDGTGTLALHWAMTCANDVIEGSDDLMPPSQVPEPTALSLLGLGLGLMGFRFRGRGHGRV
jgi:hypothetical protein